MAKFQASSIRRRISQLRHDLAQVEERLLRRRRMIRACLLERFLGTTAVKRKKPSWYLSRKVEGRTVLTYVRLRDLERVRKRTEAWREFSRLLTGWVRIREELERLLRALGEAESEQYAKGKKR